MTKSIILCGGFGTRMGNLVSSEKPKHLLKVGNESIIERLMRQLFNSGINEHTIVVPNRSSSIVKHISNLF